MRCLLCRRPSIGDLCKRHAKLYIYDKENNWFRKKKRLDAGVRRLEDKRKFRKTERKLHEILKLVFGHSNVIAGVHPVWAVSNKGALLEYDFGVLNKNTLIEYNGLQHYEYPNYFHKTKKSFMLQKGRDKIKADMAKLNGWNLIVIKYNESVTYGDVVERLRTEGIVTCEK